MTRPIFEPSPGRTDRALGFSADQLFRRPAPQSASVVQLLGASSGTNLGGTYTTLVWSDSVYPTNDSTSMIINGSGNLSIEVAGAYRIEVYSEDWVCPTAPHDIAQVDYDMRTIAGSAGYWGTVASVPQFGCAAIVCALDASGATTAVGSGAPDAGVMAFWLTSATFPAVVRIQAQWSVGGTPTATNDPTFRLAVTRFGDSFE